VVNCTYSTRKVSLIVIFVAPGKREDNKQNMYCKHQLVSSSYLWLQSETLCLETDHYLWYMYLMQKLARQTAPAL